MIPRINNLHAIRIFAALLVVYCHAGYRLAGLRPFGSFSVPMFFVISGFVMAMVATEQPRQFLQRRLLRAVPTYWFGTLVIFLLSARLPLLFHSTRPRLSWLAESLLFIPFAKAPGIIEPVMFVGWTMNCEIVLYLLIALGLRLMPRRPVMFPSVALLVLMAGCSAFAKVSTVAFFYSRSTMLCFVFGLAAYPVWRRMDDSHARALRWYAWGTLLVVPAGLCLLEGIAVAPYLTADGMFMARPLVSEIGSVLIIAAALILAKAGFDVQSKGLMLVADSTFVLYLTHAYLLLAWVKLSGLVSPSLAVTRPLGFVGALVLSMSFAVVMHAALEKPAMEWLKKIFLGPGRSRKPRVTESVEGRLAAVSTAAPVG